MCTFHHFGSNAAENTSLKQTLAYAAVLITCWDSTQCFTSSKLLFAVGFSKFTVMEILKDKNVHFVPQFDMANLHYDYILYSII